MVAFLEDLIFPIYISRGSSGGPDWPVDIVELANGYEERNSSLSSPRRSYDIRWTIRTPQERYEILKVYLVAGGKLRGFRLLDVSDYTTGAPDDTITPVDQPLGTGDGTTVTFDLWKTYSASGYEFRRRIAKPFGPLMIAIDGVPVHSGFSVDTSLGAVTFDTAPSNGQVLTWGGQFHVPVRFDSPLDQTILNGEYDDIPSILLKELRL